MNTKKFLGALLFNLLSGLLFSFLLNLDAITCVIVVNAAGAAMYQIRKQTGRVAFDGLAKEIWLPDVMEDFYPDGSFLKEAENMDALVENDVINLAEAGVDPEVFINNTVFPIPETVASDIPHALPLETYDTASSVIRNAIAVELAYDQRTLYTKKHQKVLLKKFSTKAAYSYAPQANGAFTPVLKGVMADSVLDMIIDLEQKFNDMDVPEENRVLVLSSAHQAAIAKENKSLYKEIMAKPGSPLYSFKIYRFSKQPHYNLAAATKNAYGAAFNPATDVYASFAFHSSEVMRAQGSFDFFARLKDPDVKGDKFNYQMRGIALPKRNKYIAALIRG